MALDRRKRHPHFPDEAPEAGKGLDGKHPNSCDARLKLFLLQPPALPLGIRMPCWGPPPMVS